MSKKEVHIAIIDDGVNELSYSNIGKLKYNIEILDNQKAVSRLNYDLYNQSHGSTCAAIIKKYSPHCILSSIKILEKKKCKLEKLLKALMMCKELDIDIINLSLGTIEFEESRKILPIINMLYSSGIIIVAANNNKDIITYPASFENVIGVECDKNNIIGENNYIFNNISDKGINITAFSKHSITNYKNERVTTLNCNSFAAPLVTALISNIIYENRDMTFQEVKVQLKKKALNSRESLTSYTYSKGVDWINNAIVINIYNDFSNINKLHLNLISFKIEKILNIRYSMLYKLLNIAKDNFISDTLILIISDEVPFIINSILKQFVYILNENQINLVLINAGNIIYDLEVDYNIKINIWSNDFKEKFYKKSIVCDKYYYFMNLDIPIILIYYEDVQDIIMNLYNLSMYFRNDGYNVKPIIDHPIGILYDFEYISMKVIEKRNYDLKNILLNFKRNYCQNIIIIAINNKNKYCRKELSSIQDLKIINYQKSYNVKFIDDNSNICESTFNDILRLYEYIIKLLS